MTIKLLENIRTVNQNPDSYRGWVEASPDNYRGAFKDFTAM
jgi:hypothetical protein